MRSVRKIPIVWVLAMVLTLSIFPVSGYAWTHDDNSGENYDPGFKGDSDNGERVYYNGYGPGYWAGYGPPAYYSAPPVSVVIPVPLYAPGYYHHYHYRHHRHWR
ncbi:MAG: hypothetical protein AB9866_22770 [Syntrophobacteraceae bacterium]